MRSREVWTMVALHFKGLLVLLRYRGVARDIDAMGRYELRHFRVRTRSMVLKLAAVLPLLIAAPAAPVSSGNTDTWVRAAKLTASDGVPRAAFGGQLATSGDTALVGANFGTGMETGPGAAYVYTRDDGDWSEQAKLTPSDSSSNDRFGSGVALSEDGHTALIGKPLAAYVFVRDGDAWTQEAKLTSVEGGIVNLFGLSVAISGDMAVVGAPFADVGGNENAGLAIVFTRDESGVWQEQVALAASDGVGGDEFGFPVALSGDRLLVGARKANGLLGAAYVFSREDGEWSEEARLTASDGATLDEFGTSLALVDDVALVGASLADVGSQGDQGAAYVFRRGGDSWSEEAKLVASDGLSGDLFGWKVALSSDTAVIGAPSVEAPGVPGNGDQGKVYVFDWTGTSWDERAKLVASGGAEGDVFGNGVALAGETLVAGSPRAVVDGNEAQGAAYVYERLELPADTAVVEGTVQGLGHCGAEMLPLPGATVEIAGASETYSLETDGHGFFQTLVPASESPLSITATASGHLPASVDEVEIAGGDLVVQDFNLLFDAPCATTDPPRVTLELQTGSSAVESLTVGNADGGTALDWTLDTAEPAFSIGPLRAASGVVDCDGEPGLIAHDDGTIEQAYGSSAAELVTFVDPFTPTSYPTAFRALCVVFFTQGPTSLDFEVVIFDDDGPDGAPGTELASMPAAADGIPTVPPEEWGEPQWFSYDISSLGVVVHSGSIYLGVRFPTTDFSFFIAGDESPGNPPGFAGGWYWRDFFGWAPLGGPETPEYRSLFVRAVEGGAPDCDSPSDIPWLSMDPASGSTPPAGSSSVQVTVDAAALAPGEYRAGLCLSSNDPVHPMRIVPVLLTVTPGPDVELGFDPPSLAFGEVEVGSAGGPLPVTLFNTGDDAATDLVLELPEGPFTADTGACDTLPGGGSCVFGISFSPDGVGPAAASLEVTSAEGAFASLSLEGVGIGEPAFTPLALEVDIEPLLSDGNGVFEPHELVEVMPTWRNDGNLGASVAGTATDFRGTDGAIYALAMDEAGYGLVEPAAEANCEDMGVCYWMGVDAPATRPATHWMAEFEETLSDPDGTTKTWTLHIGDSFVDVPRESPFYPAIETLLHHGVTGGCVESEYCPGGISTRSQMAVFLLKAAEGGDYLPPACEEGDERFLDVPAASPFCPWVEELAARGVTSGCGGGNYCPGDSVTRGQMAVFLLKAAEGDDYTPPACTSAFADVTCPSPFADWIEELAERGITGGCGGEPPAYCPTAPVTRAQMAAFITSTFGLTLYGP